MNTKCVRLHNVCLLNNWSIKTLYNITQFIFAYINKESWQHKYCVLLNLGRGECGEQNRKQRRGNGSGAIL